MSSIVQVLAYILTFVGELLETSSITFVILPFTFINSAIFVDENTEALSIILNGDTLVECVSCSLDVKLLSFANGSVVEKI